MSNSGIGFGFSGISAAPSATAINAAENGLSNPPGDPNTAVLGQDVGQAADPAALLNDREIPVNAFTIQMTDQNASQIIFGAHSPAQWGIAIISDSTFPAPELTPTLIFQDIASPISWEVSNNNGGLRFLNSSTGGGVLISTDTVIETLQITGNLLLDEAITAAKVNVQPKIANFSVPSIQAARTWYTNTGAAGAITFDLPSATIGQDFGFAVTVAANIVLDAGGTDIIRNGPAATIAGGTATNGTVGSVLRITCLEPGIWTVREVIGVWVLA